MKTQFKDKTQLDYLKSLPFDDLEDYTAEAAAYLIIANEMQMSGVFVPDDFDEFKDTFAGPSDPNALMIENLTNREATIHYWNVGASQKTY